MKLAWSTLCLITLLVPFVGAVMSTSIPVLTPRVDNVQLDGPVEHLRGWLTTDSTGQESELSVFLKLKGSGFRPGTLIGFSNLSASRGMSCSPSSMWPQTFLISPDGLSSQLAHLWARFPVGTEGFALYLCIALPSNYSSQHRWVHQGEDVNFTLALPTHLDRSPRKSAVISLSGFRAEGDRVYFLDEGVTSIPADQATRLRLMGKHFQGAGKILVALTLSGRRRGSCCDDLPTTSVLQVRRKDVLSDNVMTVTVDLPELDEGQYFYFCLKDGSGSGRQSWVHQGDEPWMKIYSEGRPIPKWLQIWLIILMQILSGLFSGLNLGLMSLDKTELRVIGKCGTNREKEYARTIAPLRSRGNYLLCSIVLGNVLVNSLLTVMLDDLTSGLVAVIGSTVGIVIFGEIIPQAICSRHGLAVGAMTSWVTKLFMVLTFPLSYPISKVLDLCLGEEIGNVYDRERLVEYIKVIEGYKKLEKEEVNMISGALELKKKTARDIMTPVDDVYMISIDAVVDFETVADILRQGYTRLPVYEHDRNNVVALLHTKDLALVDPDDNTPVKSLCQFYDHPIIFVFEEERLDKLLDEFKKGKSHLACIRSVHSTPDEDPYYVIQGIVTLEDVIEEIIQSEIMDETDTLTDNKRKQHRKGAQILQDFSDFVKIGSGKSIISPQLALAVFQFLSTSVDAFHRSLVSESVLRRLLTQNIFFALKQQRCGPYAPQRSPSSDTSRSVVTLYRTGKPADYFLLVLEGKVKVTVGKEKLIYEAGPFTYFGLPAIVHPLPPGDMSFLSSTPRCNHSGSTGHTLNHSGNQLQIPGCSPSTNGLPLASSTTLFMPDYTVVAVTDLIYMKVQRSVYAAALKATLLERQQRSDTSIEDCFREFRRPDLLTPIYPAPKVSPDPSPTPLEVSDPSEYMLSTGCASISAFHIAS